MGEEETRNMDVVGKLLIFRVSPNRAKRAGRNRLQSTSTYGGVFLFSIPKRIRDFRQLHYII